MGVAVSADILLSLLCAFMPIIVPVGAIVVSETVKASSSSGSVEKQHAASAGSSGSSHSASSSRELSEAELWSKYVKQRVIIG
jgi:hypothetical protein